jgi:hypothetical protein
MRIVLLCAFAALTGCSAGLGGAGGTDDPEGICDPMADMCPTGEYCAGGTCFPGCKTDSECGAGKACCGHQCIDIESNESNCGACGTLCGIGEGCCESTCVALNTLSDCGACNNMCTGGEFCDGSNCNAPTYPNFCENSRVYVIHDGIAADNAAADLMASTIVANCPPSTMVTTADQTDATLVDQTTGRPLAGSGVTYVLGGGPFPNKVLRWLERTYQVTRIYFDAPDGINYYWRRRDTGAAVAMMAGSACSTTRDQFLVELVTDPMSGTLSLVGYGACSGGRGTRAAAYHYANTMLPNRQNYPDSWYVFSWTDGNGNATPDAGDTYTVLASGL